MRNSINPKSPFLQHSTKLRFLRQRMIILIRHLIYFSRVKSIKAMLWENRESKFNDWGDYLGFFFKYQKLTTQLNWIELNWIPAIAIVKKKAEDLLQECQAAYWCRWTSPRRRHHHQKNHNHHHQRQRNRHVSRIPTRRPPSTWSEKRIGHINPKCISRANPTLRRKRDSLGSNRYIERERERERERRIWSFLRGVVSEKVRETRLF